MVGDEEKETLFTSLSVNPQGQLCLRLNRTPVVAMTIDRVITQGLLYGRSSAPPAVFENESRDWSTEQCYITLVHHSSLGLCAERPTLHHQGVASRSCDRDSRAPDDDKAHDVPTCTASMGMPLSKLDINEGRSLLVLGLLLKLMKFQGNTVSYLTDLPQVRTKI